jgi:hypothetical protein
MRVWTYVLMCICAGSRCTHSFSWSGYRCLICTLFKAFWLRFTWISAASPCQDVTHATKSPSQPLFFSFILFCASRMGMQPTTCTASQTYLNKVRLQSKEGPDSHPACGLEGIAWFLSVLVSNFWDGISYYNTTTAFTNISFPYQLLHHSTLIV